MIRKPAVAGQFYPVSGTSLEEEIRGFIRDAEKTRAVGAVIPHAGYIFSGETAGEVYSRIEVPGTCILIGPNHTGDGKPFSIQVDGKWETPLGEVAINSTAAGNILENSKFLEDDRIAHKREHSVEVQVPFLQYFRKDVQIVPLVLSECTLDVCREIGRAVAVAVKDSNAIVIASSDMTHFESADEAEDKDRKAIKAVVNLSEDELFHVVKKFRISMCGYIPTAVMLAACKEMGASKAELVKYTNSGERSGDYSLVVGYAGIIVS